MSKPDSKLISTPVQELFGKPSKSPSGPTILNGEPGLPKRSPTGAGCPEVTYDKNAPLKAPKGK